MSSCGGFVGTQTMGQWKYGVFGCCSNIGIMLKSFCLPCLVAGEIAQAVGDSYGLHCFMQLCPILNFVFVFLSRGKLRKKYNIDGSGGADIAIVFCCYPCALAQGGNELKYRGVAPAAMSMCRE